MYKHISGCDLPLYSPDFNQPTNENPAIENAFHPDACNVTIQSLRHREEPEHFAYLDHGLGMHQKPTRSRTATDDLLHLQCRLHNLVPIADEATAREPPAVDEVLVACKDLLEILQAHLAAQGLIPESGTPYTIAARSPSQSSSEGDQKGRSQRMSNCVTVLQVLTCYGYALQLLEASVDALASRTCDLGFVSLGNFSLASQPAMSTYMAVHMILGMVHQLRDSIHLLASGSRELANSPQRTQLFQSPAADNMMENAQNTTTTNSIQMALGMVTENEAILVQKLSCFTKSPYRT